MEVTGIARSAALDFLCSRLSQRHEPLQGRTESSRIPEAITRAEAGG